MSKDYGCSFIIICLTICGLYILYFRTLNKCILTPFSQTNEMVSSLIHKPLYNNFTSSLFKISNMSLRSNSKFVGSVNAPLDISFNSLSTIQTQDSLQTSKVTVSNDNKLQDQTENNKPISDLNSKVSVVSTQDTNIKEMKQEDTMKSTSDSDSILVKNSIDQSNQETIINNISNNNYDNNNDDFTYGALTYFKMNHIEKTLFKEKEIAKPESIYSKLTDFSDQFYQYQYYDPSIESPHQYYRFSQGSFNITRTNHFSMISIPSAPTLQDLFNPYVFVAFIKSRTESASLRMAIRETYANMTAIPQSEGSARVYFVLGLSEPYDSSVKQLLGEQQLYNDLFIINIVDSYQNLTLKALIPEDIFVAAHATTPYYVLGDDDSCIKTRDLLKLMKTAPKTHYYAGKCVHNKIGDVEIGHGKHSSSRLAMPFKLSFAIANLIVMSNDVIYSHIDHIRRIPAFTHIDDGEIGVLSELGKTSVQCPPFVMDLRSKPTRGYAKTVPQYAIHYCKKGRIMKAVCYGINDYTIEPDPVET